jgi:hypothetical protein
MANFFKSYQQAYNYAVDEARRYNRTIQLHKGFEYSTPGYYVNFAVGEKYRYGMDAQGEFITQTDPRAMMRNTNG